MLQVVMEFDHGKYVAGNLVTFTDLEAARLCNLPAGPGGAKRVARLAERRDLETPKAIKAETSTRSVYFNQDFGRFNSGYTATFTARKAARLVDELKVASYKRPRSHYEEPAPPPEQKRMVQLTVDRGNLNQGNRATFPVSLCEKMIRDREAVWVSPEPERDDPQVGTARYNCEYCGKPYKTKGHLRNHIEKEHGEKRSPVRAEMESAPVTK